MGRLEGQSVYLTGGAGGLGLAIVNRFVAEGARCVVLDRSVPSQDAALALGGAALFVEGDVRDAAAHKHAVETALAHFGKLDCFVGNAGVWDFNRSLRSLDATTLESGFHELFDINVLGYLLGAQASIDALTASEGSMIFTLSNAATMSNGGGVLYTAAKHAGHGIVRQLAYELAPRVRVNAVAPGAILTGLSGPASLGLDDQTIRSLGFETVADQIVPIGRIPEIEEYVPAYVFLAARDENVPATGMVLRYDGGLSVRGFLSANGDGQ
ncbi:benzene glycol dehydrogenase [Caenibius tardaugens NBRC 16725]|uniref:Benzene glycol dehydrogenase n=1 Tax=Caenibius tardaugens NBRC 16725 TaxID=1219035 RepID=U2ZYQ7_9SPHN|nr:SDR family NAD(P)-dependent oxidoreductase [Caenibius tardaugens]AZI35395.1 SDR family NAD(P)-dependent oxidoreductase [Caenibius tardaugens NBRC 16725]GAD50519.1 benzene glycol dehydrogenase [Caenibius tardaugens NBRC 16725]